MEKFITVVGVTSGLCTIASFIFSQRAKKYYEKTINIDNNIGNNSNRSLINFGKSAGRDIVNDDFNRK